MGLTNVKFMRFFLLHFFLFFQLLMTSATIIMDRWAKKVGPCLHLKNPRHDVLAVLLIDKNMDKIFIDLGHDRIRWLQVLSKSRSIFEKLRYFDRATSKTIFSSFVYPDQSKDPIVKTIQIKTPSDAQLYILLREYQPAVKKIIFEKADVYLHLTGLSEKFEDIIMRMFVSDSESTELYSDIDVYLESFLTDIGIK